MILVESLNLLLKTPLFLHRNALSCFSLALSPIPKGAPRSGSLSITCVLPFGAASKLLCEVNRIVLFTGAFTLGCTLAQTMAKRWLTPYIHGASF